MMCNTLNATDDDALTTTALHIFFSSVEVQCYRCMCNVYEAKSAQYTRIRVDSIVCC